MFLISLKLKDKKMIIKRNILELIKEQKRFENKFSNLNIREFNSFSEKKKLYVSVQYINELNKLHNTKILREFLNANIMNSIGSFLKPSNLANMASTTVGSGVGQTILEYFLKIILNKLGIPDGFLRKTVINFLLDDPASLVKALSGDCNVFTEKLIDAITETLAQTLIQNKIFKDGNLGGILGNTLRNTLMELFQNNETKRSMMKAFTPIVCKFLSTAWGQLKTNFFT
jgi:hypothetical protein